MALSGSLRGLRVAHRRAYTGEHSAEVVDTVRPCGERCQRFRGGSGEEERKPCIGSTGYRLAQSAYPNPSFLFAAFR